MYRERLSWPSAVNDRTVRLRRAEGVEIRVRDGDDGRPLRSVMAIEMVGEGNGTRLSLQLNEEGVGHLPAALEGSTLVFSDWAYEPIRVREWNGQALELRLER